jgi:hypothetical protein
MRLLGSGGAVWRENGLQLANCVIPVSTDLHQHGRDETPLNTRWIAR